MDHSVHPNPSSSSSTHQNPPHDPAHLLAQLLNCAIFPPVSDDQPYTGSTPGPTNPSASILNKLEYRLPIRYTHNPDLVIDTFDPLLRRLAAFLFSSSPAPNSSGGPVPPATVQSSGIFLHQLVEEYRHALDACSLSNELGLQSLLSQSIIQAANHLIRLMLDTARARDPTLPEIRLLWRLVGGGQAGQTDFELVLKWGQGHEIVIAVVEIKRSDLFKQPTFDAMQGLMSNRYGRARGRGLLIADPLDLRGINAVYADYVGRDFSSKGYKGLVQFTGQLNHHDAPIGAIFTGGNMMVFQAEEDHDIVTAPGQVSPMSLRVSSRMPAGLASNTDEMAGGLANSSLGLILGITLSALDKKGHLETILGDQQWGAHQHEGMEDIDDARTIRPGDDEQARGGSGSGHGPSGDAFELDDRRAGGSRGAVFERTAMAPQSRRGKELVSRTPDFAKENAVGFTLRTTPPPSVPPPSNLPTPDASPETVDRRSSIQRGQSNKTAKLDSDSTKLRRVPAPLQLILDDATSKLALSLPPTPKTSPKVIMAPSELGSGTLFIDLAVEPTRLSTMSSIFCGSHISLQDIGFLNQPFYGPVSSSILQEQSATPPRLSAHTSVVAPRIDRKLAISAQLIGLDPIGCGATSVVWQISFVDSQEDPDQVAKICHVTGNPPLETARPSEWSAEAVRLSIWKEALVYAVHLKSLQGKCVPRCYGLFGSLQDRESSLAVAEMWCLVQENAGIEMSLEVAAQENVRQRVLQAYRDIHAAGIIHGDVRRRHIRIKGSKDISLIDFGSALLREEFDSSARWAYECEREMDLVAQMLDGDEG